MFKDLQSFADGAEDRLIIFTLGSNSKVSDMPSHIQRIFFRVFSRLPQRIVCKWESKSDVTIPPNVKLVDWLPQQDLLGNLQLILDNEGRAYRQIYRFVTRSQQNSTVYRSRWSIGESRGPLSCSASVRTASWKGSTNVSTVQKLDTESSMRIIHFLFDP